MLEILPFIVIAFIFIFLEIVFFIACVRWLKSGKNDREKAFAKLDEERFLLLEFQASLRKDLEEAKALSTDSIARLQRLGSEVHAEWGEIEEKISFLTREINSSSTDFLENALEKLTKQKLSVDKSVKSAQESEKRILEIMQDVERIIHFFDKNVSSKEIVKELQTEKYEEARNLLKQGVEASFVSKKLGLSLSEVTLLSYMH